jgi:hypothetical protein
VRRRTPVSFSHAEARRIMAAGWRRDSEALEPSIAGCKGSDAAGGSNCQVMQGNEWGDEWKQECACPQGVRPPLMSAAAAVCDGAVPAPVPYAGYEGASLLGLSGVRGMKGGRSRPRRAERSQCSRGGHNQSSAEGPEPSRDAAAAKGLPPGGAATVLYPPQEVGHWR